MDLKQKQERKESKPNQRGKDRSQFKPKLAFRPKPLSPNSGQLIAITGGIGTGKTFVLECFSKLGFAVFNADKAVHDLLRRGGEAFNQVAKMFPQAVEEEGINRIKLGELVFGNKDLLIALEAVLHPLVRQKQVQFMIDLKKDGNKSAVFEVPLLFENKREGQFNVIIVTTATPEVQKDRVLKRPGMTEEKFSAIIAKQLSDSVRLKKATHVIRTNKTPEDTLRQVQNIINGYVAKPRPNVEKPKRPDRKPRAKKAKKISA